MTTAAHVPSEVETYLARVRAALADVPPDERDDLLAEVEASLHESASETGGSVAAQLGPPEDLNVSTAAPDPYRRVLVSKTGDRVFNAFPIRYYEPGTRVVLHPNAGPKLTLPRIVTPPLPTKKRSR